MEEESVDLRTGRVAERVRSASARAESDGGVSAGVPERRAPYRVLAVCAVGVALAAAAARELASSGASTSVLAGIAALLAAALIAEHYPVPLENVGGRGITATFVFGLAAVVLFGWAAGAVVFFVAPAVMQLLDRRPAVRALFNASVFALSAGAAAGAASLVAGAGDARLAAQVLVAAAVYYVLNASLVAAALATERAHSFLPTLAASVRSTALPFALMASAALALVVLWQRSALFAVTLAGPLLAITLYQRSTHRAMQAVRLALTDPLTGLGNHRHFQERLQRELVDAASGAPLALCLLDVDDFKRVNDRYGHPVGDRILVQVASRLRHGGEAFRLGGDEFAVLLPGTSIGDAVAISEAIVDRIAAMRLENGERVTASSGVATYPAPGVRGDDLVRVADNALYWAKEHGKNRVRAHRGDVIELAELKRAAAGPDRAARYRAAVSLASTVDARDAFSGGHSWRVSELAGRIARRMGLDDEHVELTRLAGSLHDLGKLAIPVDVLRKNDPLTAAERALLENHPQIGFRMLESLGLGTVARWVLHHHERYDGAGYPDGLERDEIPLPARIIFVADAFDAMTSAETYGRALSTEQALIELERCAGSQFDADVVAALADELDAGAPLARALAV